MREHEFWTELLSWLNMIERRDPDGWCDGIEPKKVVCYGAESYATAKVAFVGDRYEELLLKLRFRTGVEHPDEIDWSALLPSRDEGRRFSRQGDGLEVDLRGPAHRG